MRHEELGIGMIQLDRTFTVANVPSAAGRTGALVYISDGAAGSPGLAVSDGTNWKVVTISATTAATT
jgi:hypothetical protein